MLSLMVSVQVCSCMEDVRCEIAVVALCCCCFVVVLCVWLYTCMAVVQTREGQRSKTEAWLICECNIDGRTWSLWVLSLDVSVFSCVCTRKDGCCSSGCCVQERVRRVCAFVCCLLLLGQVWSTRFVCVCRLGFAWWAGPVCEVRWHVVAHMSCIMSMCVPLLCVLLDLMEHVTKKLDVRVDECFWRLSYERRLIGYNPRQECVCVVLCSCWCVVAGLFWMCRRLCWDVLWWQESVVVVFGTTDIVLEHIVFCLKEWPQDRWRCFCWSYIVCAMNKKAMCAVFCWSEDVFCKPYFVTRNVSTIF